MLPRRWDEIMNDESIPLTEEEIADGWHFCWEWDQLLVGPGMVELKCCHCLGEEHKVYHNLDRS
jgi:hypothetical protein